MTAALTQARAATIGADASVLDRIMAADVHLALWRRPRPESLAWIDALAWDAIDDLDFPCSVDALEREVAEGLAEAGYPRNAAGEALGSEIAALARRFAEILGCDRVQIRLEVVETDACRKFHADAVTARLLTTFSGPGTQWIETGAPDRIGRLGTGDVAIFKGLLRAEDPAILHRSPPIDGSGDTRLLLAVDPDLSG